MRKKLNTNEFSKKLSVKCFKFSRGQFRGAVLPQSLRKCLFFTWNGLKIFWKRGTFPVVYSDPWPIRHHHTCNVLLSRSPERWVSPLLRSSSWRGCMSSRWGKTSEGEEREKTCAVGSLCLKSSQMILHAGLDLRENSHHLLNSHCGPALWYGGRMSTGPWGQVGKTLGGCRWAAQKALVCWVG